MSIKKEKIKVYEMTCTSCENRVERAIKKLNGVLYAKANFSEQFAEVEYDDELCNLNKIKDAIKSSGYSTQGSNDYKFMGILIIAVGIVLLGLKTNGFDMEEKLANASYAVLFLVGVLTSIHCVGMCGGIIKSKSGSPFIVGLLNGLMPCGPLQTMQLFALGTGSPLKGALAMFMFAVGTVPLMLTFGALSGLLSRGYTKKILKFSGVLIVILGLIMGNRGLALAGININPMTVFASSSSGSSNPYVAKATIQDGIQIINMTANNNGYTPNAFYVQKGIPVKWVIDGQQMNSCNNAIVARELNLEWKLKKGENIKEFTPGDKDINFSCWMGMIRGVIKVVDDLDTVDTSKADPSLPPPSTGPSCCAVPIDEESDITSKPSIYGDDISQASTETLVSKAIVDGEYQIGKFKGIGYELQPLIVVTGNREKTKLSFNLSDFDNPEGEYYIFDATTGEDIISFTGKKGINEVEFSPKKTDGYIIIKDNYILGVVEVVDDINTVDLEKVRSKYFP